MGVPLTHTFITSARKINSCYISLLHNTKKWNIYFYRNNYQQYWRGNVYDCSLHVAKTMGTCEQGPIVHVTWHPFVLVSTSTFCLETQTEFTGFYKIWFSTFSVNAVSLYMIQMLLKGTVQRSTLLCSFEKNVAYEEFFGFRSLWVCYSEIKVHFWIPYIKRKKV